MRWFLGPKGEPTTLVERLFVVVTLTLAVGYLFGGFGFVHLGLGLPFLSALGEVRGTAPRLYVSELYVLALALLTLSRWREATTRLRSALAAPSWFLLLVIGFMLFGIARLLVDIRENPMLGVRNACFVWYLAVSCLVFLLPLRGWVLERCFIAFPSLAWLVLAWSDVRICFGQTGKPVWEAYVGFMVPVAFAFRHRDWRVAAFVFLPIAIGLGITYETGFSRTALLGIVLTIAALPVLRLVRLRAWALRLALLVAMTAGTAAIFSQKADVTILGYSANPLKKADTDASGVEVFRKTLWQDAWGLFAEHPLAGVGFQRQVVTRFFVGRKDQPFVPNDRPSSQDEGSTAPLAGPHNSYLNSIARLGVLGAVILVIHLAGAALLWRGGYPAGALLLVALMIYAFFNVGLEGPQRSMFGLLALGLALKLSCVGSRSSER